MSSILNRSINSSEDSRHSVLLQKRQELDWSLSNAKKKIPHSKLYITELNVSLDEKCKYIRLNLDKLESAGIVKAANDFQASLIYYKGK